MQHRGMADGDVFTDMQWTPFGLPVALVSDVQHAVVLHIAAGSDHDAVDVATGHGHRPKRDVGADFDGAADVRFRRDVDAFAKDGLLHQETEGAGRFFRVHVAKMVTPLAFFMHSAIRKK